ncbi:hypothetical protein EVAR_99579_1 [Eumeta japonica]|uniref:Uncharacterized protein n=1 Tax=Eumeta variegata TaxID=151549 RepID=A0A4C1ZKJ9_EUMVA|nr:hypothetical protein EVAR_99579_1 [Eumeta japonica]
MGSSRSMKYHTLIVYGRVAAAFAIAFCPVSESSGGWLPSFLSNSTVSSIALRLITSQETDNALTAQPVLLEKSITPYSESSLVDSIHPNCDGRDRHHQRYCRQLPLMEHNPFLWDAISLEEGRDLSVTDVHLILFTPMFGRVLSQSFSFQVEGHGTLDPIRRPTNGCRHQCDDKYLDRRLNVLNSTRVKNSTANPPVVIIEPGAF